MSVPGSARPYRHVVCCVESEDLSRRAIEEAARLAALGAERISVVHVVESAGAFTGGRSPWSPPPERVEDDLVDEASAWLGPLARRLGGAPVAVVGDDPPRRLADWARDEGADLIVVCPHRSGLARLLGSFAQGVVHHAPCPVLLAVGA